MSTVLPNLVIDGPLQQAQRAISARLREFFPDTRFKHHIVPAQLTPQQLDRISTSAPALGVGWLDYKPNASNGVSFSGAAEFAVFLLARQPTAETQLQGGTLLSGAFSPGIMGMAQVAIAALQACPIKDGDGVRIGTAMVASCSHMFAEGWAKDDYALAGITVRIPDLMLSDPAGLASLSDFLRFHADWAQPAGFASDDLTLQTQTPSGSNPP